MSDQELAVQAIVKPGAFLKNTLSQNITTTRSLDRLVEVLEKPLSPRCVDI